jgi:hypothetical protein
MTDTVCDLIEVAMRLSQLRDAPPPSLHLHLRPRDGPREGKHPVPHPKRVTEPHNASQPHRWDWRSKGTGA